MTRNRTERSCAGFALLDALAGLALLGLLAVGVLSMVHLSVGMMHQASRLDRARVVAESVMARLDAVSWSRLPELFNAGEHDSSALLDSAAGSFPEDWAGLLTDLDQGRIRVSLEGVGESGARQPFASSLAMRLTVEVFFDGAVRQRRVTVCGTRF